MKLYNGPVAVASRTFSKHTELRKIMSEKFSNIRFNDEGIALKGDQLIQFFQDCDGVIVALEKIDKDIISQLPALKVVSKYGVGLDGINQEDLKEFNIKLGHTPGVNKRAVSELTLNFILNLLREPHIYDQKVKNGVWKNHGSHQLSNKTVGIIGFGNIGKDLAKLIKPFNCNVLINDILDMSSFVSEYNVTQVPLEKLLNESDVITLHIPLTDQTKNLINADTLKKIRKNSILINTSRGNIVDEQALHESLKNGDLCAAAFDVFTTEPPGSDCPLLKLENFIATPHIGGSSKEGILAMGNAAIDNLYELLNNPEN